MEEQLSIKAKGDKLLIDFTTNESIGLGEIQIKSGGELRFQDIEGDDYVLTLTKTNKIMKKEK